ncbi:hemolysin family protein [Salimicrobium halophilum]|uniref:Mg2+ and Co2+ transporter CorB, contains DUF21, CBS pair, and CorC-HlyC domains n=1 Tax=Salimicrobium halophilum TaxID=86666 RepID=A0A1G8RF27_9BACI|nr:CNNM domain-containing protein [Salimicrobium halophilum]SDJ15463.1 Mg2+ and Co2+ transporter CorB, contains DUF21, CBS pair, and CorC-HlyC domains [Salimicrobium halophilum]
MIIAIIALIFVSLFFSGSETALTATNKMRLQSQVEKGNKRADKLLRLVSKPSEFITTILIGNNIANILLPTLVTTLAIEYGFSVGIASAILTIVIILFAEVIPKSVAATFPDRVAMIVYPVIWFFVIVFKPLTAILNWFTDNLNKFLSRGQPANVQVSKEDLRTMVDVADSEGQFHEEESYRIKGVLDFYNLNVKDVMKTPRVDLIALDKDSTFEEVRDEVVNNPYTRYPVYDEDIDNIVAVFHSKFLLSWYEHPEEPFSAYYDAEPLLVYEFQSMESAFKKMTMSKKHLAIVLDEYGGTEGILTHEDAIEAMIGLEIEDEWDDGSDPLVESLSDDEIICDGKITLSRLNSIFDTDIPEEEDVLAGYILRECNDFPEHGEIIEREGLEFQVLEIEGRMIRRVHIKKLPEEDE